MLYALIISGRMKNNKVVLPGLCWATDLAPILQLNLEPILCDVDLETLAVDLDELEKIFIEEKPSTLLLVSILGFSPKMYEILELCKKYDVILLEDNCESLGTEYDNKKLGGFGLMSSFSTYFGHHISTIEGGIVSTNDDEMNDLLLSIRSHGWDRDLSVEKQKGIIKGSVNSQRIWYSGHTIDGVVSFPPLPLPPTLFGVVVALVGGTWERAKFTTGENGTNMLGIWLGDNKILLDGHCVVVTTGVTTNFPQCDGLTTSRIGSPIYGQPSIFGGNMTITEPISTGNIVKRLGHAYYEDNTTANAGYFIMLFRPSNDYTIAP
jgi:hypothetical protein